MIPYNILIITLPRLLLARAKAWFGGWLGVHERWPIRRHGIIPSYGGSRSPPRCPELWSALMSGAGKKKMTGKPVMVCSAHIHSPIARLCIPCRIGPAGLRAPHEIAYSLRPLRVHLYGTGIRRSSSGAQRLLPCLLRCCRLRSVSVFVICGK